jgi:cytidylate kinase
LSIITISRGSYSKGKEIAEKVASQLGYKCISRGEIEKEISLKTGIPEVKLVRAIHDSERLLERIGHEKRNYVHLFQCFLIKHFLEDNVVYHGLAGHFFVRTMPHILKVRILADLSERAVLEAKRENISEDQALRLLKKDDRQRLAWSKCLFGLDTCDPTNYDLVINTHNLTINDAVAMIGHTVNLPQFQTTPELLSEIRDLSIACSIRTPLEEKGLEVEVSVKNGDAFINVESVSGQDNAVIHQIEQVASTIEGVGKIKIETYPALRFHL